MKARRAGVQVRVERAIGLFDAVMIGIGATLGGTIFALGGAILSLSGTWSLLVIPVSGGVMLLGTMAYAELVTPPRGKKGRAGEWSVYLPPPFGFLSGWMSWAARTTACALYATVISIFMVEVMVVIYPAFSTIEGFLRSLTAGVILLAIIGFGYGGAHTSRKGQCAMVMAQISIFAGFIIAGLTYLFLGGGYTGAFDPAMPKGGEGIVLALTLAFIAVEGPEVITTLSTDIRRPGRVIPRSMFITSGVILLLYVLLYLIFLGITPAGVMANAGETGVLIPVETALGLPGRAVLAAGVCLSGLIALSLSFVSASRTLYRMSRRGHVPASFGSLHEAYSTPVRPLLLTGAVSLFLILLPLLVLAATAAMMFLLVFILANFALIRRRIRRPGRPSMFRTRMFPLIPSAAILINAALAVFIFVLDPMAVFLAIFWVEVGLLLSYRYGGRREVMSELEVVEQQPPPPEPAYHVLVAVSGTTPEKFLPLSSALARSRNGVLTLLNVFEVPMVVPTSEVSPSSLERRMEYMQNMRSMITDAETRVQVSISHDTPSAIIQEIDSGHVNLLVMGWKGSSERGDRRGSTVNPLISAGPCDILIIRPSGRARFGKVLVTARSAISAGDIGDIAAVIAREGGGDITILQALSEEDDEVVSLMRARIESAGVIPEVVREPKDLSRAILERAAGYDLVLIGTEHMTRRKGLFGTPLEDKLVNSIPATVGLFIKAAERVTPVAGPETEGDTTGPGEDGDPFASAR